MGGGEQLHGAASWRSAMLSYKSGLSMTGLQLVVAPAV